MVVVVMAGHLQTLVLPLPLAFVPPVLEPDLDLGGGEFERAGQVLSLRRGQVPLLLETPLQLEHLSLGEEHAGFPPGPPLLGGGLLWIRVLALALPPQRTAVLLRGGDTFKCQLQGQQDPTRHRVPLISA